jgi:hypothetical protein
MALSVMRAEEPLTPRAPRRHRLQTRGVARKTNAASLSGPSSLLAAPSLQATLVQTHKDHSQHPQSHLFKGHLTTAELEAEPPPDHQHQIQEIMNLK